MHSKKKVFSHNFVMNYVPMSDSEIESFTQMFSTFQNLILAMVRNAVRVLPKNKQSSKPDLMTHLKINSSSINDQKYENFMNIKDVFLSCISDENRRFLLENAVLKFTLNNETKIKFSINRAYYEKLSDKSKIFFKKDIKKMEEIINELNSNFNLKLPEAKQQGKLMISRIREIAIPQKAKYATHKQYKKGI